MGSEKDFAEPLALLADWQIFQDVATQAEVLDEIAQGFRDSVADPAYDPTLVAQSDVPNLAQDLAPDNTHNPSPGTPTEKQAHAKTAATDERAEVEAKPTQAVPKAVQFALASLHKPARRSVFLPPLPTLAEVESGVEPATRHIAPVGQENRGILRAILGG
ncbi:MAG TPA: hypothetical protein PKE31_08075 [Pseudomonadota bacterium]|nr:hypothetical protein [Pseudomonadota bacterium]